MDINELLQLKQELITQYEKEKNNSENDVKNRSIIEDELKAILKEITKTEELIKIYQSNDKEYIILKLERLYLMMLSNINGQEYDELDNQKVCDLFDTYFPDNWILMNDLNQKEKLLLDAICENNLIESIYPRKKTYME